MQKVERKYFGCSFLDCCDLGVKILDTTNVTKSPEKSCFIENSGKRKGPGMFLRSGADFFYYKKWLKYSAENKGINW